MKARTLILTTCAAFALVAPAAQAANTQNRLFQTKVQTALWEKTHRVSGKTLLRVIHGKKVLNVTNKRNIRVSVHPAALVAPTGPTVEEFFCIDDSNAAEYGRAAPIEESASDPSPPTPPPATPSPPTPPDPGPEPSPEPDPYYPIESSVYASSWVSYF